MDSRKQRENSLHKSESTNKVVYLDQKCWIELAKMYYGEQSPQEGELVKKILEASEKNEMIFPLSISHLEETMKIRSEKRKDNLTSLMVRVSKGYSFQPYFSYNMIREIQNIVLGKLGLPQIKIRDYILKQGISNLVGAKPTFVSRKGAKSSELPEHIKEEFIDILRSPKTLEFCLKLPLPRSLLAGRELTEVYEKNRQKLSKIIDNNLRQKVFLAWNMRDFVLPEIAKILYESGLPPDFFSKEFSTEKDILEFLANIPTALCLFTLIYQRDQQLQRPIQKNDFNDIMFLTLALPYSDIVATEKMWASIARQAKLGEKCNTKILSSISELGKFL